MLDKKTSKTYRKLLTVNEPYKAFKIIDQLDPNTAKRVLMALFMNSSRYAD